MNMTRKNYHMVMSSVSIADLKRDALVLHRPEPGAPAPGRVKLPPPLKTKRDVVEILMEERQSHR